MIAERTYHEMAKQAAEQRIALNNGCTQKEHFVVSERELMILRDHPPCHLPEMNTQRTRIYGLRVAVLVNEIGDSP